MFCRKCGTQIPEGYEFCMKCGTKVDAVAFVEPTNDGIEESFKSNKIKSAKSKNKGIIAIILIVIVAILIIVAKNGIERYQENEEIKRNGLYNNISWGRQLVDMDLLIEESHKVSKEELVVEAVPKYKGISGTVASESYSFNGHGLYNVTAEIKKTEKSKHTNEQLFTTYRDKLAKLYGNYEEKDSKISWEVGESSIQLRNAESGIILSYRDNTVSGLFNDIEWGESAYYIKREYPKISSETDDTIISETIYDYEGMKGVNGVYNFEFKDDKLFCINILIENANGSGYKKSENFNKYLEKFTKLYGDYKMVHDKYVWEIGNSTIQMKEGNGEFFILKYIDNRVANGFLNDVKWGSTMDEVKALVGDEYRVAGNEICSKVLYGRGDMKGTKTIITYEFTDNKLFQSSVFISYRKDVYYTDKQLFKKFTKDLQMLYGSYKEENNANIWETKNSKIAVNHLANGTFLIVFTDINKK